VIHAVQVSPIDHRLLTSHHITSLVDGLSGTRSWGASCEQKVLRMCWARGKRSTLTERRWEVGSGGPVVEEANSRAGGIA
jgi:hypothetical protein